MGRIKDLLERHVMVLATNRDTVYVPPKKGKLYIAVGDSYNNKGKVDSNCNL